VNRINLIPRPHRQRQDQGRRLRLGLALSLLSALVLALVASLTIHYWHRVQSLSHAALHQSSQGLQAEAAQAVKLQADIAQLRLRLDMALGLREQREEALALLDELAKIVPAASVLTAIRQDERRLRLDGQALSHGQVAELMNRLELGSTLLHRPQWIELRSVALSHDRPAPPTGSDEPPTVEGLGLGLGFSVHAQLRQLDAQAPGAGPHGQGRQP
jgi:Tfp pilus assembly protein PilN